MLRAQIQSMLLRNDGLNDFFVEYKIFFEYRHDRLVIVKYQPLPFSAGSRIKVIGSRIHLGTGRGKDALIPAIVFYLIAIEYLHCWLHKHRSKIS